MEFYSWSYCIEIYTLCGDLNNNYQVHIKICKKNTTFIFQYMGWCWKNSSKFMLKVLKRLYQTILEAEIKMFLKTNYILEVQMLKNSKSQLESQETSLLILIKKFDFSKKFLMLVISKNIFCQKSKTFKSLWNLFKSID